jgi:hypothetical protein
MFHSLLCNIRLQDIRSKNIRRRHLPLYLTHRTLFHGKNHLRSHSLQGYNYLLGAHFFLHNTAQTFKISTGDFYFLPFNESGFKIDTLVYAWSLPRATSYLLSSPSFYIC